MAHLWFFELNGMSCKCNRKILLENWKKEVASGHCLNSGMNEQAHLIMIVKQHLPISMKLWRERKACKSQATNSRFTALFTVNILIHRDSKGRLDVFSGSTYSLRESQFYQATLAKKLFVSQLELYFYMQDSENQQDSWMLLLFFFFFLNVSCWQQAFISKEM